MSTFLLRASITLEAAEIDRELLALVKGLSKRARLSWSLNKASGSYLLRTSNVHDSFDPKLISPTDWIVDKAVSTTIYGNTYDTVYRLKSDPTVLLYYSRMGYGRMLRKKEPR